MRKKNASVTLNKKKAKKSPAKYCRTLQIKIQFPVIAIMNFYEFFATLNGTNANGRCENDGNVLANAENTTETFSWVGLLFGSRHFLVSAISQGDTEKTFGYWALFCDVELLFLHFIAWQGKQARAHKSVFYSMKHTHTRACWWKWQRWCKNGTHALAHAHSHHLWL